jgi:hypothetical protein
MSMTSNAAVSSASIVIQNCVATGYSTAAGQFVAAIMVTGIDTTSVLVQSCSFDALPTFT